MFGIQPQPLSKSNAYAEGGVTQASNGGTSTGCDLATNMVLRGAVGALTGAAVATKGKEGLWAAAGFFVGATLGQYGIIGILTAALWKKADEK